MPSTGASTETAASKLNSAVTPAQLVTISQEKCNFTVSEELRPVPAPFLLTLAMPTELTFSSAIPWFVLSPRSHIPKSCYKLKDISEAGVLMTPIREMLNSRRPQQFARQSHRPEQEEEKTALWFMFA